jgi:hypothetical protein
MIQEQIYGNTNRRYYYGTISKSIFTELKPSVGYFSDPREEPLIWLTTNVLYALEYAGYFNDVIEPDGKVYICECSEKMNVFNAKSRSDLIRIVRKLLSQGSPLCDEDIKTLMTKDWLRLKKTKRFEMVDALKGMGYEGFFNWESGLNYAPSIGLFSGDNIVIKDVIPRNEFETRFEEQIKRGDNRIMQALHESVVITPSRARLFHVPFSMLAQHTEDL